MRNKSTPSAEKDLLSVNNISVAVPVLNRTEDLERLLNSVPEGIDAVCVADNGHVDDKRQRIYDKEYPFRLDVLELDYDIGIGMCRKLAYEAAETEYILVCDNDMVLPSNLDILVEILEHDDSLGGAGGILEEHGHIRSGCCNFREENWWGSGMALVQGINGCPSVEYIAGHPIGRFDKLANATLIRQEAIQDYTWDSSLKDREHLAFFVGHWKRTKWEWAVCPEVIFQHNTGGSHEYMNKYRYGNRSRQLETLEAFCDKWGYERVVLGDTKWFGTKRRPFTEHVANATIDQLPVRYSAPMKAMVRKVINS